LDIVRTGPAASPALRGLVGGAFAHRRKTLVASLALSGVAERAQTQEALSRMALPQDIRAERLSPEEFRTLGEVLGI